MGRPRHPLRADAERRVRIGQGTKEIANALGLHQSVVSKWKSELTRETAAVAAIERARRNHNSQDATDDRLAALLGVEQQFPDPIALDDLCPEARRAVDDFGYFRRRYFGRVSSPWQEESGYRLLELVETPRREYAVENAPPEAGKSTWHHDAVCWLIVRTRLRGRTCSVLYLTATGNLVNDYVGWVRSDLTSPFPYQSDPEMIELGLAFDAEATLGQDFGRFKPMDGSLWREDKFRVEEIGGGVARRKEPTVAGYGLDAQYIGFRADVVLPDDVVTDANAKEGAARDTLVKKWDNVVERRLNAKGVLFLVGQRLGPADLYRYCLDKKAGRDRYDADGEPAKKYHHFKYKAYYPELDTGDPALLAVDAPPYPNGPLLDPRRLDWETLDSIWASTPDTFEVVYQQGEVAPQTRLIQEVWAWGGMGLDGVDYPGCEDKQRRWAEIPEGLAPPVVSVAMVDPSGVNNWGLMWMLYQPEVDFWHVIDIELTPMQGADLIQPDLADVSKCTGYMPEWQDRSRAMGYPITKWIVEYNAAQRHLTRGYEFVNRWRAINGVDIVPHTTGINKHDAKMGIQATIPPLFRHGKIRIPSRSGNFKSTKLVKQLAEWTPDKKRDTDLVMVTWFPLIQKHALVAPKPLPRLHVPEWLEREAIPA